MKHEVEPGESFLSVADRFGFFWKTLWDHPDNATLKDQRRSPGGVLVGDVVSIPEKQPLHFALGSGSLNSFVRRSNRPRLNLKVQFDGKPLKEAPFEIECGGTKVEGKTTDAGEVQAVLPGLSGEVTLIVRPDDTKLPKVLRYRLTLASLEALDTDAGVQQRLQQTGHFTGEVDGRLAGASALALQDFQRTAKLKDSGEADDPTIEALDHAVLA